MYIIILTNGYDCRHKVHSRRNQAPGRHCHSRPCGNLQQQCLGHCVQQLLGWRRRCSRLQATGIPPLRYTRVTWYCLSGFTGVQVSEYTGWSHREHPLKLAKSHGQSIPIAKDVRHIDFPSDVKWNTSVIMKVGFPVEHIGNWPPLYCEVEHIGILGKLTSPLLWSGRSAIACGIVYVDWRLLFTCYTMPVCRCNYSVNWLYPRQWTDLAGWSWMYRTWDQLDVLPIWSRILGVWSQPRRWCEVCWNHL
jgi:hypothetical protein